MANNCCCTSIYNAGCIGHCDGLTVSGLTGETITVLIESGSRQWTQTLAIVDGAVTVTAFNEEAIHIVKFPEPIEINGETYDCIKVKTEITTNSSGGGSGGGGNLSTFCQDVQACMAGFTPQQPAVQPPATVLIQNTTYNLQGFDLEFIGNEVDGDQLVRNFDPNGNDIAGFNNSVGNISLFNQIFGVNNVIGDDCRVNKIAGQDNVIGNGNVFNIVNGGNNTLADDCGTNYITGSKINVSNGVIFSAAWGEGHNITCNYSYMFGRWGVCPGGGVSIGNGTDDLNRNNSHLLKDDGSYQHDGAYATKPTRYTGGGNATIPDNVGTWIYDPASLQAAAIITLPATPLDGQRLAILAGGTITSGTVVTTLTLNGNGNGIVGSAPASLESGILELVFSSVVGAWYIK
jgi:hypothetical protein